MIARPYHWKDAPALDLILGHRGITDQSVDEIFVTGDKGKIGGLLVYRPGAFVHELECGEGIMSRLRAEALANYAIAQARLKGLNSAIFLVRCENIAMHRFVQKLGAIRQTEPGDVLYTLTPE